MFKGGCGAVRELPRLEQKSGAYDGHHGEACGTVGREWKGCVRPGLRSQRATSLTVSVRSVH